jgi:hypothetical protein
MINKVLGSIRGGEFLDQLSDYQLVNKRLLHTIRKLLIYLPSLEAEKKNKFSYVTVLRRSSDAKSPRLYPIKKCQSQYKVILTL